MINWLLDQLPWWTIPALGATGLVVLFVVLRAFGLSVRQALTAVATLGVSLLAATLYQRGRNAGVRSAEARQERENVRAVKTRDRVLDDMITAPPNEVRRRLERWAKD